MSKTTKPPPPIVFLLWLIIVVGVLMLFADGAGHTVGIGMIITGAIALTWWWIIQKRKPKHTPIHTAGQSQRHTHNAKH